MRRRARPDLWEPREGNLPGPPEHFFLLREPQKRPSFVAQRVLTSTWFTTPSTKTRFAP